MRRGLALLPLLLCLAPAARADEDENLPEAPEDMREGREILVQDERLRPVEIYRDTAIETEVLTEERIRELPVTNAADLVRNLASIGVQQRLQGQEAAVSIDGMPEEYTRILVDGQRWSGEIGGVDDLRDVSIENVDRVEILRGSQGVRFGTDAAGGVINIITKDPPDEGERYSYDLGGGSDERVRTAGTAAARIGPLGLSLTGEFDHIAGFDPESRTFVDPEGGEASPVSEGVNTQAGGEDSRLRKSYAYAKLDLPLGDALALRGNGLWRLEQERLVAVETPENVGQRPTRPRDQTTWRGNLELDWLVDDASRALGELTYYATELDSSVGRDFELFEDELRIDASVDRFFETGPLTHLVVAGGDFVVPRLRLDEGALPPGIDNDELEAGRRVDESWIVPSVFALSESDLTHWLSLVLGVRGRFHSDFPTRVLPQAGLLVKPHETLKLRASWGLNYRTPSLRDLFQPPTPQLGGAYFLAGSTDLEPEESVSWRAGFEWSPAHWISLGVTGFFNDIEDFIRSQDAGEIPIGTSFIEVPPDVANPDLATICEAQALFFPDPADWTPECRAFFSGEPVVQEVVNTSTVFRKTNLDNVRTWGAVSQLKFRLGRWAEASLTHTWLRTDVRDSNVNVDELPNRPEHAATGDIVLTAPRFDSQLTVAARWRGEAIPESSGTGLLSFADASQRTDPSLQLDVQLVQPLLPWLELYAAVFNATDERVVDSFSVRGRTFFAGVRGVLHRP